MQHHATTHTLRLGAPLSQARAAVILIHGRGSSAEDIAGLADALPAPDVAFLAPSATGGTWYPNRFLVPLAQNEPWLSSALAVIGQLIQEAASAGLGLDRVGLTGLSQGACLSLEYAARNPARFAFVGALSGSLIGPLDTPPRRGDLHRTPILVACAENDPHIPLNHVEKSAENLTAMNADLTKQIYPGNAHRVFPPEIEWLTLQLENIPKAR